MQIDEQTDGRTDRQKEIWLSKGSSKLWVGKQMIRAILAQHHTRTRCVCESLMPPVASLTLPPPLPFHPISGKCIIIMQNPEYMLNKTYSTTSIPDLKAFQQEMKFVWIILWQLPPPPSFLQSIWKMHNNYAKLRIYVK